MLALAFAARPTPPRRCRRRSHPRQPRSNRAAQQPARRPARARASDDKTVAPDGAPARRRRQLSEPGAGQLPGHPGPPRALRWPLDGLRLGRRHVRAAAHRSGRGRQDRGRLARPPPQRRRSLGPDRLHHPRRRHGHRPLRRGGRAVEPVEVKLRSPQPGGWLGEATTPEGGRQSIVMHRSSGVETQAMAAPRVVQPPPPRASRASADRAPTRGKARKGRHGAVQRRGHATAKSHSRGSQHSASRSAHSKASKGSVRSSGNIRPRSTRRRSTRRRRRSRPRRSRRATRRRRRRRSTDSPHRLAGADDLLHQQRRARRGVSCSSSVRPARRGISTIHG